MDKKLFHRVKDMPQDTPSYWLIFSDIHFDLYKPFSTILPNGIEKRLMEQVQVIQQIRRLARRFHATAIFFLGDLFNSQGPTVNKVLLNVVFYAVQSLAEIAPLYILIGNHDIYRGINILTPFTSIPNVTIINELTSLVVEGHSIDFVPWLTPPPTRKSKYCFGHFGIQGATVNNQIINDAEEISLAALEGYQIVCSGHYHTRQIIGSNYYQIGSVMATAFKDSEEDKGVWSLEPVTNKLTFIPINSPKFHTRRAASSSQVDDFLQELNTQDYWKLIVESDGLAVPDMPPNVLVEYDFSPSSEAETIIDTTETSNLVPIIQEFIDRSNTALDKTILKKKAIELLEM